MSQDAHSSLPVWTPPERAGLIPLRPMTFGTILSASFVALRANPKLMFGCAVPIQTVALIVGLAVIGVVTVWGERRIATTPMGSDDFSAVLAGVNAVTFVSTAAVGVLTGVLTVVVQVVVVAQLAYAIVGERPSIAAVWRRSRRALLPAVLYTFALTLALGAVALAAVALMVLLFTLGDLRADALPLFFLIGLVAMATSVWLLVKVALAISAMTLERTGFARGVSRSWRLTQGRFWKTFGVYALVTVIFNAVASAISVPVMLGGSLLLAVLLPTGTSASAGVIAGVVFLAVAMVLLIALSAVGTIVQATALGLVYIDARMRTEALDQRLMSFVEQRSAGVTPLPDPYLWDRGRSAPTPGGSPAGSLPGSIAP